MVERKIIDWEGVEIDYRAGILTIREIGTKYGVSHTLVNRRAKQEGWDRDISKRIREKADAIVSKALVSESVSTGTVKEVVESAAIAVAEVRLGHRKVVGRMRTVGEKLLKELEFAMDSKDIEAEFHEALEGKDVEKMNSLIAKVNSIGGRAATYKTLAEANKIVIALEREAYGIDDRKAPPEAPTVFNLTM